MLESMTHGLTLEETEEELFWGGIDRVALSNGVIEELTDIIAEPEITSLSQASLENSSSDVLATAFRSKSSLTQLFRGLCMLEESRAFVTAISKAVPCSRDEFLTEVYRQLELIPPLALLRFLRQILEQLISSNISNPSQLVGFFFWTRFVCPGLLRVLESEAARAGALKLAKELGAFVGDAESITSMMKMMLTKIDGPAPTSTMEQLLERAFGIGEMAPEGCSEMVSFINQRVVKKMMDPKVAHLWDCILARQNVTNMPAKVLRSTGGGR
jgi:hypothetical protein